MPIEKDTLLAHLRSILKQRIADTEAAVASTLAARNSDTKSSAGDKHEVGRAMAQQELDQLEGQLANTRNLLHELAKVPMERTFDQVGFGSMVRTDLGTYFIAVGLGAITVDGERCFAVSLASPIGQALNSKRPGETVLFNGKTIAVLELA